MSWFCIDDGFAFHAKAIAAGNEACGAWARAGSWSGAPANLTDGYIPKDVAHQIARPAIWQKLIDAKAGKEHGLIEVRPDGYQIHDYLKYNPSAEKVRAKRAAWVQRQKKAREKSGDDTRETNDVSRRDNNVTHENTIGLSQRSPFPIPHSPGDPPGPPSAAALAATPGSEPEPSQPTATPQTLAGIWPTDPEPRGVEGAQPSGVGDLEAMARYAMTRPAELTPYERSRVAKVHARLVNTLAISAEDRALIVEVDTKLALRDDANAGPAPSSFGAPVQLSGGSPPPIDFTVNAGPKRETFKPKRLAAPSPMPEDE